MIPEINDEAYVTFQMIFAPGNPEKQAVFFAGVPLRELIELFTGMIPCEAEHGPGEECSRIASIRECGIVNGFGVHGTMEICWHPSMKDATDYSMGEWMLYRFAQQIDTTRVEDLRDDLFGNNGG